MKNGSPSLAYALLLCSVFCLLLLSLHRTGCDRLHVIMIRRITDAHPVSKMTRREHLILFIAVLLFIHLTVTLFLMKNRDVSPIRAFTFKSKHTATDEHISSRPPRKKMNIQVKFYKPSSNRAYHYEYRYELNKHDISLNESRLIVLLAGRKRACIDWWHFSSGKSILSQMRSSGFSILAICTSRKTYQISMPIQKNLDIYWIYTTLQMWMNDVYYKHFQHYPRLYLFGISKGSRMSSLLCRVLPVQAQILYIVPGYRRSLLMHSDHNKAMQNRLILDYTFANWFYFDYCLNKSATTDERCPFHCLDKNYLNPVPPTYFVHYNNDPVSNLSQYQSILSNLKDDAILLGGVLLSHHEALKLYVVQALNATPDYMRNKFDRWKHKPHFSQFFYEHFINATFKTNDRTLRTCWCMPKDFMYFDRYPNITQGWSKLKQKDYHDYVKEIKSSKENFCETVCGQIMATHAMSSHHVNNTLHWLDLIDHERSLYQIEDFHRRPLRLWIYNKSEIVLDRRYLTYQTPIDSSCGRQYPSHQMYSPEYFLHDYFQRLEDVYPLSRHNLIWAKDPLLADYYVIPHDYVCIDRVFYRPTSTTESEHRFLSNRLNQNYLIPLLSNVRTLFPYWNMTSGANHIIAFTVGRNMGITRNSDILDTLKHVIQLGFTGMRQDLLPRDSPPLYIHKIGIPVYRHNYDIVIPPFNRLQSLHDEPLAIRSDSKLWYKMRKNLLFFAGTVNNSMSMLSARTRLSLLVKEDFGERRRYENISTIDEKQLNTISFIDGHISSDNYVESIRSSVYHLCPEGFSPWSPRLYESICLGAIPLILAESIVLPFERFIDWRSFSTKFHTHNVRNIIDVILRIDQFEDYVGKKLKNAATHFHAFRWPYTPVNEQHDRHSFLPQEDSNGTIRNVFHYLSLELRCRRLEQYYGLVSDHLSIKSIKAKRQACSHHPTICPCYEEKTSLAIEEYV